MTSRNRVRRRLVQRRSAREAWMDRNRQQGAISLREIDRKRVRLLVVPRAVNDVAVDGGAVNACGGSDADFAARRDAKEPWQLGAALTLSWSWVSVTWS